MTFRKPVAVNGERSYPNAVNARTCNRLPNALGGGCSTARSVVCGVGLLVSALACGDEADAPEPMCLKEPLYEVNVSEACLLPAIESRAPCLLETEETSSGTGTRACLVSPEGKVFLTDNYGFTFDLGTAGWEAFGLEVADSEGEHGADEHDDPPGCEVAWDLLGQAIEDCESDRSDSDDLVCNEWLGGFPPELVMHLPFCKAASQ